jgi:benzil reductase ((S)-benzoin forming)
MNKILIITGGSKGLGTGIVRRYLEQQYTVFSIARTLNSDPFFEQVTQYQADLCHLADALAALFSILKSIDPSFLERIVLIHNAATLGQINRLENIALEDIERTMQLNVLAPFHLNAAFLKQTADWTCPKKIIQISSGAAQKNYVGLSVYCTSKAALDHMTRGIAMEQNRHKNGARIIAIYPGVIDTDMQLALRGADLAHLEEVERFKQYKVKGDLKHPDQVGKVIFDIDLSDNYDNGAVINVETWP